MPGYWLNSPDSSGGPGESGSFQADESLLGKSRNPYLRYYLIKGANSVRVNGAEHGHYCRTKYDESTKHKQALVLTARKLVRSVDAMLRRNQLYISLPMNTVKEVSRQGNIKTRPAK